MAHYLIIRTSSLGDIALSLRLIYALANRYPEHRFTYLMKPSITGILVRPPHNLEAMAIDIRHTDRSILGLLSLARKLKYDHFDAVIDLQRSWRSGFLVRRLRSFGYNPRCLRIEKTPEVKRSQERIAMPDVPTMLRLFEKTFLRAGLVVEEPFAPFPRVSYLDIKTDSFAIGIAPLQKQEFDLADLEEINQLISVLQEQFPKATLYLFGFNNDTALSQLNVLQNPFPREVKIISKVSFARELARLSTLKCLVCADNSSAHLAQLMGPPTIPLPALKADHRMLLSIIHQIQSITSKQTVPHECENQ